MKDIKIGALTFKPKAIKLIFLCLFVNVIVIGIMVLFKRITGNSLSLFVVYPLMLLPYLLMRKKIGKNLTEEQR